MYKRQDFHFKEEEKLQENVGYPGRETHHEKHEEFKKTIQELQEYLQDYEGPTEPVSYTHLDVYKRQIHGGK